MLLIRRCYGSLLNAALGSTVQAIPVQHAKNANVSANQKTWNGPAPSPSVAPTSHSEERIQLALQERATMRRPSSMFRIKRAVEVRQGPMKLAMHHKEAIKPALAQDLHMARQNHLAPGNVVMPDDVSDGISGRTSWDSHTMAVMDALTPRRSSPLLSRNAHDLTSSNESNENVLLDKFVQPIARTCKDIFEDFKIDISLMHKNVTLLNMFVDQAGKCLIRGQTGLSRMNHRRMVKCVKRARALGLIPSTGKRLQGLTLGGIAG